MKEYDVDVVITWVDGNDPQWIAQRDSFLPDNNRRHKIDSNKNRFRDWDNLQYIFRGIEVYMPWVRNIYFVTWGHLPSWLNTENPKLHVVKHQDFIPREYLPTFNSNTIDLNLFRIPGIADRYIYFNDDMFVIKSTKKEDFFVEGLPRDLACLSPQPIHRDMIRNIEVNNLKILNDYFSVQAVKENKKKWFDFASYRGLAIRTAIFMKFSTIIGIFQPHVPFGHMKENIQKIWEMEYEELDGTCRNRFRSIADVNEWLFRSWQLLSGEFYPRKRDFGILITAKDTEILHEILFHGKQRLICINDDGVDDFENTRNLVNKELQKLLPEKSSFEK